MEAIAILAGLAFAVNKTVTVLKSAVAKEWNTVVTQGIVWVVGLVAVFLATRASITANLVVPGLTEPLGTLDGSSIVLLSWILSSSGSFVWDFKNAVAKTDTPEPKLLTGRRVLVAKGHEEPA